MPLRRWIEVTLKGTPHYVWSHTVCHLARVAPVTATSTEYVSTHTGADGARARHPPALLRRPRIDPPRGQCQTAASQPHEMNMLRLCKQTYRVQGPPMEKVMSVRER